MTGFTSNISEIIERFKVLKEKAQNVDLSDALLFGVNAAKGGMENRIFTRGLDAGNVPLGSYAGPKKNVRNIFSEFLVGSPQSLLLSQYEKKRVKAGRQIRYKDLEFTGTLRRGIVVIKESQTRVVCSIPNEDLIKIARGQEEKIGAEIFSLSDEERELLRTNVIAAVNQIYVRLFNS